MRALRRAGGALGLREKKAPRIDAALSANSRTS
jgi:hypothetical protein